MRYPLLTMIGLAYGWTWITVLPLMLQGRGIVDLGLPHYFEVVGAFGPMLAAIFVLSRTGGAGALRAFFRSFLHWRVGRRWLALTVLSPLAFLLLALCVVALQGGAWPAWPPPGTGRLGSLTAVFDLILFGAILQSLGEEPGWRGYLLPGLLARFRRLPATLLIWPVWWLWHLPFFLSRPEFGIGQLLGFGLGILAASVWMTVLWEGTQSIFIAILWHALLNITRGIAGGFSTAVFLTYGLVVTVGAVAIVIWWLRPARPAEGLPVPAPGRLRGS